jgi:predicted GIY-YIG superfamily endonuclease
VVLVHTEEFTRKGDALRREAAVKRLRVMDKRALFSSRPIPSHPRRRLT